MSAIIVISVALITLPSVTFAGVLNKSAEEYRRKGYAEQQQGNLGPALDFYSKALSLGAKDAVLYNDIGILYEQFGSKERAEEFYLEAIALNPEYLPPYTNLAYSYLDSGDNDSALTYFKERLKRAPADDPWRDKVRAEIYKIDPRIREEDAKAEAAKLTRELTEKAHSEFYSQIVRSDKHFQKGQELRDAGQLEEALKEFELALSLTPDNPKVMTARTNVIYDIQLERIKLRTSDAIDKLEDGDVESAREEFQSILAEFPKEAVPLSEGSPAE